MYSGKICYPLYGTSNRFADAMRPTPESWTSFPFSIYLATRSKARKTPAGDLRNVRKSLLSAFKAITRKIGSQVGYHGISKFHKITV